MPQLRSHCVLCCEIICNPLLNSKDLTDWHKDCLSSFCETLQLDPSCLSKTRFCLKCQQLLRDINFLLRNVEKFQKKLRVLSIRAKALLLMNAKQLENETELYSIAVRNIVSSLGKGKSESTNTQIYIDSTSDAETESGFSALVSAPSWNVNGHGIADEDNATSARPKRNCDKKTYADEVSEVVLKQEIKDEACDFEDQGNYEDDDKDPDFNFDDQDFVNVVGNASNRPVKVKRNSKASKTSRSRKRPKIDNPDPAKPKYLCAMRNCSVSSYSPVHLQAHVRRVHEGDSNPYYCDQCELKFKKFDNLQTHGRDAHGIPLELHPCPSCNGSFRSKRYLKVHISEQHPVGPAKAKCSICTKSFDDSNELEAHEDLHKSILGTESPFSCVICNLTCAFMIELQDHVRKKHEGYIKCPKEGCEEVFPTKPKLELHVRRRHPTRDRSYLVCPICSYQATAPFHLKEHMVRHDPNKPMFSCDREGCGKSFCNQKTLTNHLRYKHDGLSPERSHKCLLCPKAFETRSGLSQHQVHHSNKRSFLCEHCSLSFKTMHNLKTHYKVHEEKTKGRRVPSLQKPRKARLPPVQVHNIEKDTTLEENRSEEIQEVEMEILDQPEILISNEEMTVR